MGETGADHSSEAELRFAELLRLLSLSVAQATRNREGLPALSDSQVFAIRALVETGGLTPTQLAARLELSRPTISEVVRSLEDDDLVVRRRSKQDGRSVVLTPTEHARHVLDAFRRGRVQVTVDALRELPDDERAALLACVTILDDLVDRVTALSARPTSAAAATA